MDKLWERPAILDPNGGAVVINGFVDPHTGDAIGDALNASIGSVCPDAGFTQPAVYGQRFFATVMDCANDGHWEVMVFNADGTGPVARQPLPEQQPGDLVAGNGVIAIGPDFYDPAGVVRIFTVTY